MMQFILDLINVVYISFTIAVIAFSTTYLWLSIYQDFKNKKKTHEN